MSDVLDRFNTLVARFTQLQGWIRKAGDLAHGYRPEVVERVIVGHTRSRDELLVDLIPMMVDVEAEGAAADQRREALQTSIAEANVHLDELDLRQLIGEIDDTEHADLAAPHRDRIDGIQPELTAAIARSETLRAALAHWEGIAREAEVLA